MHTRLLQLNSHKPQTDHRSPIGTPIVQIKENATNFQPEMNFHLPFTLIFQILLIIVFCLFYCLFVRYLHFVGIFMLFLCRFCFLHLILLLCKENAWNENDCVHFHEQNSHMHPLYESMAFEVVAAAARLAFQYDLLIQYINDKTIVCIHWALCHN